VLTGFFAGASLLTKIYTIGSILAVALWLIFLISTRMDRGRVLKAALLCGVVCAGVGMWPTVRSLNRYGRLHVDNFSFFPSQMRDHPPGSLSEVSFFSFQYVELLRRPWMHKVHVASFPTELFGSYWFDYEGLCLSLALAPEWRSHRLETGCLQ